MMPACTGLPPGLLMRRMTPATFFSLNALCSDSMIFSALEEPLDLDHAGQVDQCGMALLVRCLGTPVDQGNQDQREVAETEELEENPPAPPGLLLL
jgi:hypothetical protein